MTEITTQDLQDLLSYFLKNTYKTKDADVTSQSIMQTCLLLTDVDYTYSIINNSAGEFCAHYPSHLIILQNEKSRNSNTSNTSSPLPFTNETIYECMYDPNKVKELIKNARIARCRSRFALPVILYKGRYICRSATLSSGAEIYGRSGMDYLFSGSETSSSLQEDKHETREEPTLNIDWQLFDKVRQQDIKLLKILNVRTIIDLMVEKKKVKYGLNVTSSEKADKEKRYSDFNVISLPYPGCEFFKEFKENNYVAEGLLFDWSQSYIDAEIGVLEDSVFTQLQINWQQYQGWDLVQLTQNYFMVILKYLSDNNNGILIHCISGWDRTPLFISLLRISLWADGVIHTSLNSYQLLYYTIAYDWMLFGHDLANRYTKGEDIFFFCFHFLKYICDDKFSIHTYDDKFNIQRHSKFRHSVLRTDSDAQLDNVMFDNEISPNSNISCNSSTGSSHVSRDNQDLQSTTFYSYPGEEDFQSGNVSQSVNPSPNKETAPQRPRSPFCHTSHTSPVSVPIPCHVRQRYESCSSSGSWQLVSGAGSLHGSTNIHTEMSTSAESNKSHIIHIAKDEYILSRKDKIQTVRSIFYKVYSQYIGFPFKDNLEPSALGQLIGNFAEKVGIVSPQYSYS